MSCSNYKQDILLLIHGELGFAAKVRLKAHLGRCASCRAARANLASVSQLIGAAIRSPEMPPWQPHVARPLRRIPLGTSIIVAVVLIGAGVLLTGLMVHQHNKQNATRIYAASSSTSKCTTCCSTEQPVDHCK